MNESFYVNTQIISDSVMTLTQDIEFLQLLSNPYYINVLKERKYFDDPQFIKYLNYLQYLKKNEFVKYIKYTNSFIILDLLINEDNRKALLNSRDLSEKLSVIFEENWFYDKTSSLS